MLVKRSVRVADEIRAEMSEILLRSTNDPRIGFITITRVEVDNALKNADIYFTKMGTEQERHTAFEGLMHAKPFFRRELAKRLRVKLMPALRFFWDDEFEKVERINYLINQLKQNNHDK